MSLKCAYNEKKLVKILNFIQVVSILNRRLVFLNNYPLK